MKLFPTIPGSSARLRFPLLAAACFVTFSSPLFAQRNLTDIPVPDPELERASFQVAEGFEVNLFAADPQIAKPIQMNFDSRGRLWIVSSEVYPQIKPGQEANDRVLILEDKDGDGVSDQTTVFADGLLIPTGIEPGDGGAYVANSTELLHFRDVDGDGRADERRVILSGFGTEDTHHILHTLRWGPDGMLYFNQSIYIHSHIETPHGVRRLNGGGIWQFRPETMKLEVIARGFINSWGHHFDEWGQQFATDGAGGEGINYVLPGAAYVTAVGVPRLVKGLNPGSPKYCGLEVLSGSHLPEEWRGNLLTNDFRGHRVCRFVISEDGAGFAAREQPELIKTTHVAFRPIDIKMGPDGAIYIADWYNPIIQHGEVDFRDPRRDHTRGRIWRVTAKGRPLVPRPQLVGASTAELLDALNESEDWTRHHAKRVLKERGAEVLPQLAEWVQKLDANSPAFEQQRLEALWTYQSLDVVEPESLTAVLRSPDHRVRAAATRIVGHWADRLPNPLALLAERVADEHPRVRLEAVRSLAAIPQPRAIELAMQALDRPVDRYVDYALWLTARELQPVWLPALQEGKLTFGGNPRHLAFALEATGSREVVKPVLAALAGGNIGTEQEQSLLTLVAAVGAPDDLATILKRVIDKSDARLLTMLAETSAQRNARPAGDLTASLRSLLDSENPSLREAALRAAGLWKVEGLRPQLTTIATDSTAALSLRLAALASLGRLGGEASRATFGQLAGETSLPEIRIAAVAALAGFDANEAAALTVKLLNELPPETSFNPLIDAFLAQKNGPAALTAALAGKSIPEDAAKIVLRIVRSSARQEPALVDALAAAGKVKTGVVVLSPEEMQLMVEEVRRHGDPARGERLYRRDELACMRCHAIGGAGGQVGPDLVSLGASAQIDYLIDSLLQPNKAVKENYHSLVVVDEDGKLYSGIKVRETDTQLVLRNAEDREISIPLDSIDEQAPGGSLMPAGLTDSLTRGELVDLVRFLSELGKVGPYSVSKARLVRRWQVLEPTPAAVSYASGNRFPAGGNSPGLLWRPVYSQVSGNLPLEELPRVRRDSGEEQIVLRCELDVSTAGRVQLILPEHAGRNLALWIDDEQVEPAAEFSIDLASGIRHLKFVITAPQPGQSLSCELRDIPGSPAQVQPVSGK